MKTVMMHSTVDGNIREPVSDGGELPPRLSTSSDVVGSFMSVLVVTVKPGTVVVLSNSEAVPDLVALEPVVLAELGAHEKLPVGVRGVYVYSGTSLFPARYQFSGGSPRHSPTVTGLYPFSSSDFSMYSVRL